MTFTASNGIRISTVGGDLQWRGRFDSGDLGYGAGSRVDRAMAEWYRHREDEQLGRVRLPGIPSLAIYPKENNTLVHVVDERNGTIEAWNDYEFEDFDPVGAIGMTAKAYFDSLEPAPKPGEHWRFTYKGETYISQVNGEGQEAVIEQGDTLFWFPDEENGVDFIERVEDNV